MLSEPQATHPDGSTPAQRDSPQRRHHQDLRTMRHMCGKSRSIGARGSTTRGNYLPAIGTDIARHEVVVSPRSLPRKNLERASQPLPSPCKYHHHHVYFCVEREFSSTKDTFISCLANNALNWLPKPCEAGRCGKWR